MDETENVTMFPEPDEVLYECIQCDAGMMSWGQAQAHLQFNGPLHAFTEMFEEREQ